MRSHIEECRKCRLEYEDLHWFSAGMRDHKEMIIDGHIDSRLLHEYVECPNTLEAHTIGSIAGHLRTCDICREACDVMRELIEADRADVPAHAPTENPLFFGVLKWISRPIPRPVLVAASVALIAISATFGTLGIRAYQSYNLGKGAAISVVDPSMRRGPNVKSLSLSILREVPSATQILSINRDSLGTSVIEVMFESLDVELAPRKIEIANEEGKVAFRGQIPKESVEAGTLGLSLNSSRFLPGRYTIKLVGRNGDIVCSGAFEISSP